MSSILMKKLSALVLAGSCVVGVALVEARPAAASHSAWSRSSAFWYAYTGLYERYVFGGAKWINNDVWDPAGQQSGQEGVDCSAYASKAFALPTWRDPLTVPRISPPDYTGYWWNNTVHGAYQVGWNAGAPDYLANAFVWHNGTGQHMGLTISFNHSNGYYNTWEALNSTTGVINNFRTWVDVEVNHAARRLVRSDWTP